MNGEEEPVLNAWLFPMEGEKPVPLPPHSCSLPSVFKQQCPGWEMDGSMIFVSTNEERTFFVFYDLRFHADPPSPFNRAWELYAHTGQLTSAIPLLRGPVVLVTKEDLSPTRDRIEQHYLRQY
jgi:hypothetical protein